MHAIAKYAGLIVAALFVVANAQFPANAQDPTSGGLAGHWRKTTIMIDGRAKDEHLVLHANGAVEDWVVTASGQTPPLSGAWQVQGKYLSMQFQGRTAVVLPFTFYQGQLVLPNIPNKRGFWKKIAN